MRVKPFSLTMALGTAGLLCVWAPRGFAQSPDWYKFGPAARYQGTTVYDANSDIMVLFGGQHTDTTSNYNDVWWAHNVVNAACLPPCDLQWNGPTNMGTIPSARFGHSAIYDPVNLRMVVFAGATGVETPSPCLNDLYVLENAIGSGGTPIWIKLSPTGSPPPIRYSHNSVYDAADNLMIVFGGSNCGSTYYNDVWVLTNANGLGGTPAWSQLSPSGPAPSVKLKLSSVARVPDGVILKTVPQPWEVKGQLDDAPPNSVVP